MSDNKQSCSQDVGPAAGWAAPATTRLLTPETSSRGLFFRALSSLSALFGRQEIPDIFSVMHLNPGLFWGWIYFASRFMPFGRLPATVREKIILRTAWNCRCRYEWGQHVDLAIRAGVSDEDIVRVERGADAFPGEEDRALIQACDDVFHNKCLSDATWSTLSRHYNETLLIEIVMLIGHYEMVASFLNTAGIALEPCIEEALVKFHQRTSHIDRPVFGGCME